MDDRADRDQVKAKADDQRRQRLTRRKAAERLTDIAYALTAGGRLKLGPNREVSLPAGDDVALECETRSEDGRVELGIELSWEEPP
jgi:amphi-Trp domain-containing protein